MIIKESNSSFIIERSEAMIQYVFKHTAKRHKCERMMEASNSIAKEYKNELRDDTLIMWGGLYDHETESFIEECWVLSDNGGNPFGGLCVPVEYCPFCGDKLEKPR